MALTVNIIERKHVSEWVEYKDENGNVLAEFHIRGIDYKPYQVSLERTRDFLEQNKDKSISLVTGDDKFKHEYMYEAMAHHLIIDWKGVELSDDMGETYKEVKYTPSNALKLLRDGDIGVLIWGFIFENATSIQKRHDEQLISTLGKSQNSTNGNQAKSVKQSKAKSK